MHTTIEFRPYLKGNLEVHVTRDEEGNVVNEAFAFASLANVLALPLPTLEGRYNRSNAKTQKINLRTGAGRPARGFPLAMLQQVIDAMLTPGARFAASTAPAAARAQPLVATPHNGVMHYTVQSLADHYGVTAQTVRNRVRAAGLDKLMVPLVSPTQQGGRPRLAFKAEDMVSVRIVMEDRFSDTDGQAPHAMPATSTDDNPILHGLRVAGMTSDTRDHVRRGMSDPVVAALVQEIEAAVDKLKGQMASRPAAEPVDLEAIMNARREQEAQARVQYIPIATPHEWYAEADDALARLILTRDIPDFDYLRRAIAPRLAGQGEQLGLTPSADALAQYINDMRERVRVHLRPYEQMMDAKVDEWLPADCDDRPDPLVVYAMRRALYTVPVYLGQIPLATLDVRVRRYGNVAAWTMLTTIPTGESERSEAKRAARRRLLDTTQHLEAFERFKLELQEAKAQVDAEHGVNCELHPTLNGRLVPPDGVVISFATA